MLDVSEDERADSFSKVILFFSAMVMIAAVVLWYALRFLAMADLVRSPELTWSKFTQLIRLPQVRLHALIILCAYSGYRVADNFSILAQDMLGYDEVQSAAVGTLTLWLRPIAAIGAGIMADRVSTPKMTMISFALLLISGLILGLSSVAIHSVLMVFVVIVTTSLGVYALRGLYFAIMEEGRIPIELTGTAVGIASVIGYLPDIYMASLTGWFIDEFPGAQGYHYVFLSLAFFALIGLLAIRFFRKVLR